MDEEAFLRSIMEESANAAATWLVLADWREERADPRAELVRLCHDPFSYPHLSPEQRDDRIRALLASGVPPCVPTITNSIGMKFALIPAGSFLMGSPESEAERREDEEPRHEVEITWPFYLGIHLVTQKQYKKVMGNNPSWFVRKRGGGPNHPVEHVRWEEAVEFCRKLSARQEEQLSGHVYRLPTEAEWEYACRGGATSSTPFSFGDSLSSVQASSYGRNLYGSADIASVLFWNTPVGAYQPNAYGLLDTHSNVHEWCRDWYGANYYSESPRQDPQGPQKGELRVLRGGSCSPWGNFCRSASRFRGQPNRRFYYSGIRVVCVTPGTS